MNNNTRIRKTKQQWRQIDPQLTQELRDKIVSFFENKPLKYRLICASLFFFCNRFRNAYQRQDTMAKWANTSLRHTSRILSDLEAHGIIATNYRHMTSCLYKLSSFFNDFKVRESLKHLFVAFSFLPIAALEVRSDRAIQTNVLQYNNNYIQISLDNGKSVSVAIENQSKWDHEAMYDSMSDWEEPIGGAPYQSSVNTHLLFTSATEEPKKEKVVAKDMSFPKPSLANTPMFKPDAIAAQVAEMKKSETKSQPRAKLWTGHSSGMDAEERRLYRERMAAQFLKAKAGLSR